MAERIKCPIHGDQEKVTVSVNCGPVKEDCSECVKVLEGLEGYHVTYIARWDLPALKDLGKRVVYGRD